MNCLSFCRTIFLISLCLPTVAAARIYHVKQSGTQDFITIQQAISDLRVRDGDTIVVYPGVYRESIVLAGKAVTIQSIDPTDPCTVAATVIDTNGAGSAVICRDGETPATVLDGLTLTGGRGDFGGGVLCLQDSGCTLRNCVIRDNSARLKGGGIWIGNGSGLVLIDSRIICNRSEDSGGGIYCYNTPLRLEGCEISFNRATGVGAGIYLRNISSTVIIQECRITHNSQARLGGALFCHEANLQIVKSYFAFNESSQFGGAMFFEDDSLVELDACVIVGNRSDSGGGIYFNDHKVQSRINHCIFSGNRADRDTVPLPGGALQCVNFSKPRCRSSIFWQNRPKAIGSRSGAEPDVQYCLVENGWGTEADHNLEARMDDPRYPGPQFLEGGFWDDNQTPDDTDDDVWVEPAQPPELTGYHLADDSPCIDSGDPCFVPEPEQTDWDGEPRFCGWAVDMGIDETSPEKRILNVNTNTWYAALSPALDEAREYDELLVNPGLYRESIFLPVNLTLRSRHPLLESFVAGTILDGQAASSTVSFIGSQLGRSCTLEGFTIQNGGGTPIILHSDDMYGGGILCIASSPTISHCIIKDNKADWGGALAFVNSESTGPLLRYCIIKNNTSRQIGGALVVLDSNAPEIINCSFTDNNAEINGGGIYIRNSSGGSISFSSLKHNQPYGLYMVLSGGYTVENSILWDNQPLGADNPDQIYTQDPNAVEVSYSNIENGWAGKGSGNLDKLPQFAGQWDEGDPDDPNDDVWIEDDFRLKKTSPCINAGDPDWQGDPCMLDLAGQLRKVYCRVDIGPEEVNDIEDKSKLPGVVSNPAQNKWYCTIQEALDEAESGQEIIVAPGTYHENIHIARSDITLKGTDPRDLQTVSDTVIQGALSDPCGATAPVILLEAGRAENVVIEGLTIQGGTGFSDPCDNLLTGGGICSTENDNLTITRCNIRQNQAGLGGGIYLQKSTNLKILGCQIQENIDKGHGGIGGGVLLLDCNDILIENDILSYNTALNLGGALGFLRCQSVKVNFCSVVDNMATVGGGCFLIESRDVTISNSIFWKNWPSQIVSSDISGEFIPDAPEVTVFYSDIQGGWQGVLGRQNINIDPCFVDIDGFDYHLQGDSPCINRGDPCYVYESDDIDIDGEKRLAFAYVDMGADEVQDINTDSLTGLVKNNSKNTWYRLVQKALDDAGEDQEIILYPGRYRENLTVSRKGLILRSINPADKDTVAATIIDGSAPHDSKYGSVIYLQPNRADRFHLEGITLTQGTGHFIRIVEEDPNDDYRLGGGICSIDNDDILLSHCRIIANRADSGAGIYIKNANNPTIEFCLVGGNYSTDVLSGERGGGIYLEGSDNVLLRHDLVCGNSATIAGGGIYANDLVNLKLEFCTIANNAANGNTTWGGGLAVSDDSRGSVITNSIIWANNPYQIYTGNSGRISITYSDVEGGFAGEGNIWADPCFVAPADSPITLEDTGNYHLKSQVGHWDGRRWVVDTVTSPCIDGGNPAVLPENELWPHGMRVNLGVYGNTPEASLSGAYSGNQADINIDNQVDSVDFALLAQKWGARNTLEKQDRNDDGTVDLADLVILIENWLWR